MPAPGVGEVKSDEGPEPVKSEDSVHQEEKTEADQPEPGQSSQTFKSEDGAQ